MDASTLPWLGVFFRAYTALLAWGGWERGLCGIDFFGFRSLTSYVGRWVCGLHMGSHTHINPGAS